jgi:hypothetical protein
LDLWIEKKYLAYNNNANLITKNNHHKATSKIKVLQKQTLKASSILTPNEVALFYLSFKISVIIQNNNRHQKFQTLGKEYHRRIKDVVWYRLIFTNIFSTKFSKKNLFGCSLNTPMTHVHSKILKWITFKKAMVAHLRILQWTLLFSVKDIPLASVNY